MPQLRSGRLPVPNQRPAQGVKRTEEISHIIAGLVKKDNEVVGDVEVFIRGYAAVVKTDKKGRFIFNRLRPGKHTLVARVTKDKLIEKEITILSQKEVLNLIENKILVPPVDFDIDLEG